MIFALALVLMPASRPFSCSLRSKHIKGRGQGRRKRIQAKKWRVRKGGGGKRMLAIKTPIGSFLWLLAAAKL